MGERYFHDRIGVQPDDREFKVVYCVTSSGKHWAGVVADEYVVVRGTVAMVVLDDCRLAEREASFGFDASSARSLFNAFDDTFRRNGFITQAGRTLPDDPVCVRSLVPLVVRSDPVHHFDLYLVARRLLGSCRLNCGELSRLERYLDYSSVIRCRNVADGDSFNSSPSLSNDRNTTS